MKFFNTAGPVNTQDHYLLPTRERLDEQELRFLIEQKKYFILHAPRQTGKTSTMLEFAKILNEEGKYNALYINVESAQAARGNYKDALPNIIQKIFDNVRGQLPSQKSFFEIYENVKKNTPAGSLLETLLKRWCEVLDKPLVLFIDEIDSLIGDTLISVLRQLRSGYTHRPEHFPQSVCLIGVRDVRDYRIWSEEQGAMVLGGSAFNIKAKSLRMTDFTAEQVRDLYLQHTTETGQKFDDDAIEYAFEQTQGQPWLVNALAYECCFEMIKDRSKIITKNIVEEAKETLILRQDTHLDVLIDRLREPRIRNIIDAIIKSESQTPIFDDDDIKYAVDLGLIKVDSKDMKIANPIYQEILPRALATKFQHAMSGQPVNYILDNGLLDTNKLLNKFADFYRQNSEIWLELFDYKESGPHLILLAFFQRIINGGGQIHREYALGRGRVDLLISWKTQRIVIELKLYRDSKTLPDGLRQTFEYMDTSGATQGHLVIFDKRDKTWDEKVYQKEEAVDGIKIFVWGM
jgi:hypothetical protein